MLAPASMTFGSVAGGEGADVAPASPLPCETVIPASTAASLKRLTMSTAVSGRFEPPKDSLRSFSTFQDLVRRYPESEYVADARQRMVFLRNRLAQYENHVANYYIERGAYVAAVNRAKYALEHYPGAPELEKTLQIMVGAYEMLGMMDLAAVLRV